LSNHHIVEGNRRKSSYAVCDDIPLLPQAGTSLWHVLLSVDDCKLSVLPQVHFDVVSVTRGVAQFVYFQAETFAFLGNTLRENCLSFEEKNKIFFCLIFGSVVNF